MVRTSKLLLAGLVLTGSLCTARFSWAQDGLGIAAGVLQGIANGLNGNSGGAYPGGFGGQAYPANGGYYQPAPAYPNGGYYQPGPAYPSGSYYQPAPVYPGGGYYQPPPPAYPGSGYYPQPGKYPPQNPTHQMPHAGNGGLKTTETIVRGQNPGAHTSHHNVPQRPVSNSNGYVQDLNIVEGGGLTHQRRPPIEARAKNTVEGWGRGVDRGFRGALGW